MLALALPIMLANASVPLVGIVDTAVMGRMAVPAYLAATAIGAVIFSSVFWLFGFLRMGTGGLVAQALGAGSQRDIELVTGRAMLLGVSLALLLLLLQAPILQLALAPFSGSESLLPLVRDYYYIRILAAPATLATYVVMGTLIGLQRTRDVFWLQMVLNLTNVALTIFFFSVFSTGIKGVALATVIAEYLALAAGLYWLRQQLQLWPPRYTWRELLDPLALMRLMRLNFDLFIRTLCLTLAFYWLTRSSARLGEVTLAANTLLLHLVHLVAHALDGFAHAAETLCGHAYGQRNLALFRRHVSLCSKCALLLAGIVTLLYWLFGESLIALMTTLPEVRAEAARWLPWILAAPLIGVWSFLLDGIYIGVTHSRDMRNGMLMSVLVFLLATWLLIPAYGNHGLWASYTVLMIARAVTLGITYPRIVSKLR